MARWIVAGLVVLNVMLGVGVYLQMEGRAHAAIGASGGNYVTVAGQSNLDSVVYILDVNRGQLAALKINGGQIKPLATRDIGKDLERIK
jgi:hypothetical protein